MSHRRTREPSKAPSQGAALATKRPVPGSSLGLSPTPGGAGRHLAPASVHAAPTPRASAPSAKWLRGTRSGQGLPPSWGSPAQPGPHPSPEKEKTQLGSEGGAGAGWGPSCHRQVILSLSSLSARQALEPQRVLRVSQALARARLPVRLLVLWVSGPGLLLRGSQGLALLTRPAGLTWPLCPPGLPREKPFVLKAPGPAVATRTLGWSGHLGDVERKGGNM